MRTVFVTKQELFALLVGRSMEQQYWRCQKNVLLYISFDEYCNFMKDYRIFDMTETRLLPLDNSTYADAIVKGTLLRTYYYDLSEILYNEIEIAQCRGKYPTCVAAYFDEMDDIIKFSPQEVEKVYASVSIDSRYEKHLRNVRLQCVVSTYANLLRKAAFAEKKKYQLLF